MLTRNEQWLAPGHNGIVTDAGGVHWILYHAVDVDRPRQRQEDEINSRRVLLIDRIDWRTAGRWSRTPSTGAEPRPRSRRARARRRAVRLAQAAKRSLLLVQLGEQALRRRGGCRRR